MRFLHTKKENLTRYLIMTAKTYSCMPFEIQASGRHPNKAIPNSNQLLDSIRILMMPFRQDQGYGPHIFEVA